VVRPLRGEFLFAVIYLSAVFEDDAEPRVLTSPSRVIGFDNIMPKRLKARASQPRSAVEYNFTVFFQPAIEGGYVVTCPALPGMVTEGDTLAEARRMAHDAIQAYLESLRKDGQPIPKDPRLSADPVKAKIKVAIPA